MRAPPDYPIRSLTNDRQFQENVDFFFRLRFPPTGSTDTEIKGCGFVPSPTGTSPFGSQQSFQGVQSLFSRRWLIPHQREPLPVDPDVPQCHVGVRTQAPPSESWHDPSGNSAQTSRCRQGCQTQPVTLTRVSLVHAGSHVFSDQGNGIKSVWKSLGLLDVPCVLKWSGMWRRSGARFLSVKVTSRAIQL